MNSGSSVAGGGTGPPRPAMFAFALFAKWANFFRIEVRYGCICSTGNCLSRDVRWLWLVRRCSAKSLKKGAGSKAQETYFSKCASDAVCRCEGKYFSASLWILSTMVRTSYNGRFVL